ncbi:MAG: hypothetical protein Ta2A_16330 [Treponemataceae bacterium]|nr:MAG: hypothetical protein Ta2A_16330 [Treponemataceae bacterium]
MFEPMEKMKKKSDRSFIANFIRNSIEVFAEIFGEYKQLFSLIFRLLVLVLICFAFSFALVFPLWNFATHDPHLFSIVAISFCLALVLYFCVRQTAKSIKTGGIIRFLLTLLQIVVVLAGISAFFALVVGGDVDGGAGSRLAAAVCILVTVLIYGALKSGKKRLSQK